MRRSTLHAITASIVGTTVLLLASFIILPPLLFWGLEEYAKRESLQ